MKKVAILESKRSNEFRIPIHPKHFDKLTNVRDRLYFQDDYANKLELSKDDLAHHAFKFDKRDKLLKNSDIIFLLKPTKTDLEKVKEGSTLIGWCHAVQQIDVAKIAIQRKLTLIAMEEMYEKLADQAYPRHLFYENNYITGYEGIAHALSNSPISYPVTAKIAIVTYGNVSHGAVVRLQKLGYQNITVFTRRKTNNIHNKVDNVNYHTLIVKDHEFYTNDEKRLKETLQEFDIIINGIKQDPVDPFNFFSIEDLKKVKHKLLVDLSCDENMGFEFSHETTWENPISVLYSNYYYAVPNVPSVDWENVSYLISNKLVPLINAFINEQYSSEISNMLENATEIKLGVIVNSKIIEYQKKVGFL